jgi:ABC-type polysaccharide transport system permease subunit
MFMAFFLSIIFHFTFNLCFTDTGVVNQVLPANGYSTISIGIQYTNENSRYIPVNSCKEALTADGCDQITQCGVDEVIPYVVVLWKKSGILI